MSPNMIIIVAICAVLFIIYSLYAGVIQKKNKVQEAFSSIDVQIKKRYDSIPNILTLASKFMEHEKALFEDITKLRTKVMEMSNDINNMSEKIKLDSQIADLMKKVIVSVENYPELKSDQTMLIAMQAYNETEGHVAAARRFYNSAVLELNNAVEIFPSSLFALMLGIKKQTFFVADEKEKQEINVNDYIK